MSLMSAYNSDQRLSRQQLDQIRIPPSMGRFHRPVAFADFVGEVVEQLDRVGLEVREEEHMVSQGDRYFGLMEVGPREGDLITADDWKYLMGLRASYSQVTNLAATAGRHVMVCSNLCFGGDFGVFGTKQTTNAWDRIPALIHAAVDRIPEMSHREERRVEALKGFEVKPRWGDAALVEILRRGGLTSAQLGRAIQEWDEPTHPEFAADGHTAWRLEQAVTEAAKPTGDRSANLLTVQSRTQVASQFIDEVMGF